MISDHYLMAAFGGVLIGTASVLLLRLNGRIAGISGIMNGVFAKQWSETAWRIAFIAGLVAGGFFYQLATNAPLIQRTDFPFWLTIAAGLLVGYGTRMGSGCTSGHGICGVGRLSVRSIAATATFVLVGMLVATSLGRILS